MYTRIYIRGWEGQKSSLMPIFMVSSYSIIFIENRAIFDLAFLPAAWTDDKLQILSFLTSVLRKPF